MTDVFTIEDMWRAFEGGKYQIRPGHDMHTYLALFSQNTRAEAAWNLCRRGDWLAWLVTRRPVMSRINRATLRAIACDSVELVLPIWQESPLVQASPYRDVVTQCLAAVRQEMRLEAALDDNIGVWENIPYAIMHVDSFPAQWVARAAYCLGLRPGVPDALWFVEQIIDNIDDRADRDALWLAQAENIRKQLSWEAIEPILRSLSAAP